MPQAWSATSLVQVPLPCAQPSYANNERPFRLISSGTYAERSDAVEDCLASCLYPFARSSKVPVRQAAHAARRSLWV